MLDPSLTGFDPLRKSTTSKKFYLTGFGLQQISAIFGDRPRPLIDVSLSCDKRQAATSGDDRCLDSSCAFADIIVVDLTAQRSSK